MQPQQHYEKWFAVQVWTQHENRVNTILLQKGLETFLPTKRIWRRWCDRTQAADVPLFPGYVFAWFDPENRLPVLVTPKVQGIVGFGNVPTPVDDAEIGAIRILVASNLDIDSYPTLAVGQRVDIVSGPLAGVSGVLTERRSVLRLIVSIQLLNRSISVEVTNDMLAGAGKFQNNIPPVTRRPVNSQRRNASYQTDKFRNGRTILEPTG
jgi:transcription antitermination factor NusG